MLVQNFLKSASEGLDVLPVKIPDLSWTQSRRSILSLDLYPFCSGYRISECSRTHYHLQKAATKAKVKPMKTGATMYNKGIEETREVRAILVVQLLYGRE